MHMSDKEKRTICSGLFGRLIRGRRAGKRQSEIIEGIRAGLGSDHLSLDDGLARGSTIVDPVKFTRAMDGKDEAPRRAPLERDIVGRIERAKQECAAEASSTKYRAKAVRQKKAQIHNIMDKRGTNEITARIRGYDVTLMRIPEIDAAGMHKLKMFVNSAEIPDKDFDVALAEVSGFNDSKTFNAAAEIGKELKDQAGIQGARTATKAGIAVATTPARAAARSIQESEAMAGEIMRMFLRMILTVSRSR